MRDFKIMKEAPKVEKYPPASENRPALLKEAIYLDTETSHTDEATGWIYQWSFSFNGLLCYGRKPTELLYKMEAIAKANNLDHDTKCLVLVHNLSYDIQYLKDYFLEYYQTEDFKILAVAPHKFISFECGPWIFRCTYKLSNRSLAKWGSDLGIKSTKKKGLIDYSVIRYQDTRLTRSDWIYMFFDVLALEECVKKQMELEGDNLSTLPLTSTAYVRRDSRREYKKNYKRNRKYFLDSAMDVSLYKSLHTAFAGGLVHGNRFVADTVISGPIGHGDFTSMYPSEQVAEERGYPCGKFGLLYRRKEGKSFTFEDLDKWTLDHCTIIIIAFHDLEVKEGITLPYAQLSKFKDGKLHDVKNIISDNGRILKMSGTSIVSLTELDLKWIRKQYTFTYQILKVWAAPRGPVPDWLERTVKKYFYQKSHLKAEVKKAEAAGDDIKARETKISLSKAKGLLNGIYGMTATNPVRTDVHMDEDGNWTTDRLTDDIIKEKLEKYYESKSHFMTYALGIYCTALARNKLMTFVETIGYDNFIYADTDSIFFFNEDPAVMQRIVALNNQLQEHAEKVGAYIEVDGKKVFFDHFDIEEDNITEFKFLHAKAYAYNHNGKLHATIAGVSEYGRKGNTRVKELGSIENLKHGKTFTDCGGTRCVYVERKPTVLDINGHITELASSAIILETEKTMNGLIAKDEQFMFTEIIFDEEVENTLNGN